LWREVPGKYELEQHELALLRQTVRTVDRLDRLDEIAAAEGLMVSGNPKRITCGIRNWDRFQSAISSWVTSRARRVRCKRTKWEIVMAKVVGVHGIAQEYRGPNYLAAQWLPSLQDGIDSAGGSLAEHDFSMAFYGNMFLEPGFMDGGFPPLVAADLDDPEDAELLELVWREAARVDPNVPAPDPDPDAPPMGQTPQWVQHALNALSQSSFFAGLAQRAMIGAFKQVRLYFTDPIVRARAINSVRDVVTDETRVVIGHSLGSVVAFEALAAAKPDWRVHTLVTLGSPLGIRNLIFDRLEPPPVNGRGRRPAGLQAWVNVAAPGDVVALVKDLALRFDGVVDHLVATGSEAHDVQPYLTRVEVGRAVLSGLA
jgi:hypothetical protein